MSFMNGRQLFTFLGGPPFYGAAVVEMLFRISVAGFRRLLSVVASHRVCYPILSATVDFE